MNEPRDTSLGNALGWLAVLVGMISGGLGLIYTWQGQGPDGIDGLIFGGLALAAGCVILYRRKRMARSEQNESGQS